MTGFVLRDVELPQPGFGHVFAGGSAPILAYEISQVETRIMFDQPLDSTALSLEALPTTMRRAMERVISEQNPLHAANYAVTPEAIAKDRFVCMGDAGGSCHPLTATGLSACARDAILLRAALRQSSKAIPDALRRYVRLRETPQRTRMVGAEVLYDVFRAQSPDMRLLRNALFRYWQHSREGRVATMSLLSTEEARFSVLLREYIRVCRHALPELIRPSKVRRDAMRGLSRALVRLVSVSGK
jgi:2-polyprenyl-6-methoxyphenol hydroxylase-like FAD-dependent oxidoreductase